MQQAKFLASVPLSDPRVQAIKVKYRDTSSLNGYRKDDLLSALQKAIRRGMSEEALFAATEMYAFRLAWMREPENKACVTAVKALQTNLLHRLMIIFLEDVGLAGVSSWDLVASELVKFKELGSLPALGRVVSILRQLPKSRSVSHASCLANVIRNPAGLKILEKSACYSALLELYRGYEANKGQKLRDVLSSPDISVRWRAIFVMRADEIAAGLETVKHAPFCKQVLDQLAPFVHSDVIRAAERWSSELRGTREGFLIWWVPLLYAILKKPLMGTAPLLDLNMSADFADANLKPDADRERFKHMPYVFDKHTAAGRKRQHESGVNGTAEFALQGAHVENPWPEMASNILLAAMGDFYVTVRTLEETLPSAEAAMFDEEEEKKKARLPLETEHAELLVRAQLVTFNSRTDVYFAKVRDGVFAPDKERKLVVMKGPLADASQAANVMRMIKWKKANGIPFVNADLVYLVPDRWPEGTPSGVRNKIASRHKKQAPFLQFDSLVPEDKIVKRMHSSKCWPPTEVADPQKMSLHLTNGAGNLETDIAVVLADPVLGKDYVEALIFRYVFGIPDLADRNFLVAFDPVSQRKRVFSVDEDAMDKPVHLFRELQKTRAKLIQSWIMKRYELLNCKNWVFDGVEDRMRESMMERIRACQGDRTRLCELFNE